MYNLPGWDPKVENWLDPFLNNSWIKIAEYQRQRRMG